MPGSGPCSSAQLWDIKAGMNRKRVSRIPPLPDACRPFCSCRREGTGCPQVHPGVRKTNPTDPTWAGGVGLPGMNASDMYVIRTTVV